MARPSLGITIADVDSAIVELLLDELPATAEDVGAILRCGRTTVANVVRAATGRSYPDHAARFRPVPGIDGTPSVALPDADPMVTLKVLVPVSAADDLRRLAAAERTSVAALAGRLLEASLRDLEASAGTTRHERTAA